MRKKMLGGVMVKAFLPCGIDYAIGNVIDYVIGHIIENLALIYIIAFDF